MAYSEGNKEILDQVAMQAAMVIMIALLDTETGTWQVTTPNQ